MDTIWRVVCLTVVFCVSFSTQEEYIVVQSDLAVGTGQTKLQNGGPVYGSKQCGGPGKLVNWRIEGCKTTDSPCQLPSDDEQVVRGEIDFVPSRSIPKLAIRISTTIHGSSDPAPQVVTEKQIENSSVTKGVETTLQGGAILKKVLAGKRVTIQSELFDVENNQVELCFQADLDIL